MIVLATNHPPTPEEFELICELVYKRGRIKLASERKREVAARLGNRLQATGIGGYREYCAFLESPAGESELSDLLAGLSGDDPGLFARPHILRLIAKQILPQWSADPIRRPGDLFRVWSVGCQAGEEAYSIAVTLAAFFASRPDFSGRVSASDSSARLLGRARDAIFQVDPSRLPDPDWLRRYFVRGVGAFHGWWRLKEEVKNMVTFRQAVLFDAHPPFVARMDVIVCRDFQQFDPQTRDALRSRLSQQLAPGGLLLAGESDIYRKPDPLRELP